MGGQELTDVGCQVNTQTALPIYIKRVLDENEGSKDNIVIKALKRWIRAMYILIDYAVLTSSTSEGTPGSLVFFM